MTGTTEENGPEIELCWMVAPVSAIEDFLERHGETDYGFGFTSDGETTLYIRGVRTAVWRDALVWRRGGKIIVAREHEVPFIEGHAVVLGLEARGAHGGRVVSYWAAGRTVVVDAAPIESKTAIVQWMARHPVEGMRLSGSEVVSGTKKSAVKMPDGKVYNRRYWLVWARGGGVQGPVVTARWRAIRGAFIKNGVSFRQMFEGAELGFERRNTGVN